MPKIAEQNPDDTIANLHDEVRRLERIEAAAVRFLKEADEHPRYLTVRTWATADADPYRQLRDVVLKR